MGEVDQDRARWLVLIDDHLSPAHTISAGVVYEDLEAILV
jgi:hypothetical protein